MEALQPLSIESFSYRWLISIKHSSSFDAMDDSYSFIDIDPKLTSLHSMSDAHDFDFCTQTAQPSVVLSHADQIISDGLLLPFQHTNPQEEKTPGSPDSVLSRSLSVDSSRVLLSLSKRQKLPGFYNVPSRPISQNSSPMLLRPSPRTASGGCGGTKLPWSKKIIKKYLCFLMPFYKKVKGLRTASGRRRRGDAFSGMDWCRPSRAAIADEGVEKSIHEAVLHCKKSIGRDEK